MNVLRGDGKHIQAIEQLERGLRISPRSVDLHLALGRILMEQGQTAAAVEHLETVLAIQPNHKAARADLQRILARVDRKSSF